MDRIDLHTHSKHSDGTYTPRDLVALAAKEGLRALALTDHDTTSGVEEAIAAGAELGVEIIPGSEVSTTYQGRSVHVLAHGICLDDPGLISFLERVRAFRVERNELMIERLTELGCPLTMEEVSQHAEGRIVARPHFARAMIDRGYVPDFRAAFTRYIRDGGPGHVVVERMPPAEAVEAIRAAGGMASIAHPKQIALENDEAWERFFGELADAGLAGLEVDHPSQRADDRKYFAAIADRLGFVRTGGSDFHGSNKPRIKIGTGNGTVDIRYETWTRLNERGTELRGT